MTFNRALVAGSFLLLLGFTISGYLLIQHFELAYLNEGSTDICSVVFGTGCDSALSSPFAEQLGIPLAGWGMIYYGILGVLLFLGGVLGEPFRRNAGLAGWGLVLAGAGISLLLLSTNFLIPELFCPLCAIIHGINLVMVFPARQVSGTALRAMGPALKEAGRFLILGKSETPSQARNQVVAFSLVLLAGLAFYQWVRLQESAYRQASEASFMPDLVLEDYMAQEVKDVATDSTLLAAGPADAPVQMVVFSDFQCPACRDFSEVEAYLFQRFNDRMLIIFKHFPLSSNCNPAVPSDFHPRACAAARAGQAAARQGQFWPYHNALFSRNLEEAGDDFFVSLAGKLGLNEARFRQDFNSGAVLDDLSADIEEGRRLGLRETPAVFLNGRRVNDLSPHSLSLLVTFLYYQKK